MITKTTAVQACLIIFLFIFSTLPSATRLQLDFAKHERDETLRSLVFLESKLTNPYPPVDEILDDRALFDFVISVGNQRNQAGP
jgi:hypothetical protein